MIVFGSVISFVNLILFFFIDVFVRLSSVYYGGYFDISRLEIVFDFDVRSSFISRKEYILVDVNIKVRIF